MVAMKDFELLLVRGLRRPGHIVTGDSCRPVERGARLQPGWPLVRGPEPGGDAGSLEFSFEDLARRAPTTTRTQEHAIGFKLRAKVDRVLGKNNTPDAH